MKKPVKLVAYAKKAGALEAKIIAAKSVVTAHWVRLKCQYGCDGYGRCLTCPPFSPTPEETRKVLDEYQWALLIHGAGGASDIQTVVSAAERDIFLAGYYKAYGLAAGPCRYCRTCNLKNCKFPSKARPSMEASGIDVFQTARNNGFKINVVTSPSCERNYYGLILIE